MSDRVELMMKYEAGDASMTEIIDLFQDLIDNDMLGKLQGHYGRVADQLIKDGMCHKKEEAVHA
jgi:hypothetical protein